MFVQYAYASKLAPCALSVFTCFRLTYPCCVQAITNKREQNMPLPRISILPYEKLVNQFMTKSNRNGDNYAKKTLNLVKSEQGVFMWKKTNTIREYLSSSKPFFQFFDVFLYLRKFKCSNESLWINANRKLNSRKTEHN